MRTTSSTNHGPWRTRHLRFRAHVLKEPLEEQKWRGITFVERNSPQAAWPAPRGWGCDPESAVVRCRPPCCAGRLSQRLCPTKRYAAQQARTTRFPHMTTSAACTRRIRGAPQRQRRPRHDSRRGPRSCAPFSPTSRWQVETRCLVQRSPSTSMISNQS